MRYRTTVRSNRPPDEVFDYLAEFSNTVAWDPSVTRAERLDAGPLALGSLRRLIVSLGRREVTLDYRVYALDRPRHVDLRANGPLIRLRDSIYLVPDGAGTLVDYEVTAFLRAMGKPLTPWLRRRFRRACALAREGLSLELNA